MKLRCGFTMMPFAGFNVQVDVLNTTVVGYLLNCSLPSIEVMPPSNGFNVTWSALMMTLEINAPNLIPFTKDKQLTLTALTVQASASPGSQTSTHEAELLHACM